MVELLKGERASNLVVLDLKDDGPGPIRTLVSFYILLLLKSCF